MPNLKSHSGVGCYKHRSPKSQVGKLHNMKSVLLLILFSLLNDAVVQSEHIAEGFPKANADASVNAESNFAARSNHFSVATGKTTSRGTTEYCECVPYHLCNNIEILEEFEGDGLCDDYSNVCCKKHNILKEPIPPPTVSRKPKCGIRNPNGIIFSITLGNEEEAEYAEFPWMVAILRDSSDESNSTNTSPNQCGASLIHAQVVLTAAHCVSDKNAKYKIRAGDWDMQTRLERYPHQDRDVKTVIIHPQYKAEVLFNNIALLILETPVEICENVDVVCLPQQDMIVDQSRCFASGWGKDAFGKYQSILKKIELSIVHRNSCQDSLRKTRLGKYFELDASFICAGGKRGKDTCKGDGGSPLVCPVPGLTDRYFQAGIVSWGISCGTKGVPGVYANVPKFTNWIDKQLVNHNLDVTYYKY